MIKIKALFSVCLAFPFVLCAATPSLGLSNGLALPMNQKLATSDLASSYGSLPADSGQTRTPLVLPSIRVPNAIKSARRQADTGEAPNLGPLQLFESGREKSDAERATVKAEREQLADLWEAALEGNADIQFVVQRLTPTSEPKHARAVVMKILSAVIYGGIFGSGFVGGSQNPVLNMTQTNGISLIRDLLGKAQPKEKSKSKVTDSEAIVLYGVVRGVADRLSENFFEYRKNVFLYERAVVDDRDLRAIAAEVYSSQDAIRTIELHSIISKSRRELLATGDDIRRTRQALIDLAGNSAVKKLDDQIDVELAAVESEGISARPAAQTREP